MVSLIRNPDFETKIHESEIELGEKAKVKETVRLFTKVWQLPSYRQILLILILLTTCTSLFASVVKLVTARTSDIIELFLLYMILLGVPVFLGTSLLYLIGKDEGSPLDARRTAGAVMFGLVFWYILGIIGVFIDGVTSSQFFEIRFYMLGAGIAYFLFAFLVNGLSDHSLIRNMTGAVVPIALWVLLQNYLPAFNPALPQLGTYWYVSVISIVLVPSLVVWYIYRIVSVPFERDLGINGPQLLRAFGHDYLADNPVPLEDLLTKIATIQDVPMEVILFSDDDGLVACGVIEYVHPGPFRDIGSSDLPSVIMQHIKDKHNIPSFVLHGSCTHQQNLTTKNDYPKVLNEIDRLIQETNTHNQISGPHWNDGGKFKVWTFFAGDDVLTISTSAPEFTDDISLEVGFDTANMVRKLVPNIGGVAIVDAHNCINDDAISVNKGDPEASEYVGTVSEAVFSTMNAPKTTVEMGIFTVYPEDVKPREGIGPGGVTVVILKTNGQEMALVSVDGNNVEPGFREKVISLLKSQGFDNAEITTTDTHVVNAISLSSRGYPPVGRNKPDETLEHIVIASTKARESIKPVRIGLGFGRIEDLRTFGEKGFDTLTKDVAEAASIAKKIGVRSGGLALLILIFTSFLF
ncbi:DUF2070 family protein [Candidatus Thorarchaeota archaeon]|nr:MAG: DUF2070 family protein [Candidatus Thorarchaeota archaeon]